MIGDGKGKTTSAIGVALRSHSYNHKVIFAQYLKDGQEQSLLNLNISLKCKFSIVV